MDQLLNWVKEMPVWITPLPAAAVTGAAVWLFTQWRRRGGEQGNLRTGLIVLVTLALAGGFPRLLPKFGTALDRLMGAGSALQVELLSLAASAAAAALVLRGRQLLARGGTESSDNGSYDSTAVFDSGEYGGGKPSPVDTGAWDGGQPLVSTTGGAGVPMQRHDTILRRPTPKKGQVAWLAALRGPHTGQNWTLGEECTLGRGVNDPCDIVLSDAKVSSGQHARIRLQKDGTYYLADLASRNGTWVNGQRMERHTLSSGDKIVIGDTEMIFMQADIRPSKGRRGPGGAR